jgi:hypothetical protein
VAIADRSHLKPSSNPWMTKSDLSEFDRLRKDGAMTFFRTASCRTCSREIHHTKQFCSRGCYEKSEHGSSET